MRIPDGFIVNPTVIIGGWIIAVILISIVVKYGQKFEGKELSSYAALGAYVFVLQFIPIPFFIPILPFPLTLSGIALVLTITGLRKGLLISIAAVILNHLFLPGAIAMLGLNLTNLIIAGTSIGYISSQIYKRLGRRLRYLGAFLAGLLYMFIAGILIYLEYVLTHQLPNLSYFTYGFAIYFLVLGLLEGSFTAIASSYYYRERDILNIVHSDDDTEDDEILPIDFLMGDDEE